MQACARDPRPSAWPVARWLQRRCHRHGRCVQPDGPRGGHERRRWWSRARLFHLSRPGWRRRRRRRSTACGPGGRLPAQAAGRLCVRLEGRRHDGGRRPTVEPARSTGCGGVLRRAASAGDDGECGARADRLRGLCRVPRAGRRGGRDSRARHLRPAGGLCGRPAEQVAGGEATERSARRHADGDRRAVGRRDRRTSRLASRTVRRSSASQRRRQRVERRRGLGSTGSIPCITSS